MDNFFFIILQLQKLPLTALSLRLTLAEITQLSISFGKKCFYCHKNTRQAKTSYCYKKWQNTLYQFLTDHPKKIAVFVGFPPVFAIFIN